MFIIPKCIHHFVSKCSTACTAYSSMLSVQKIGYFHTPDYILEWTCCGNSVHYRSTNCQMPFLLFHVLSISIIFLIIILVITTMEVSSFFVFITITLKIIYLDLIAVYVSCINGKM